MDQSARDEWARELRSLRDAHGLTQLDLSRHTGATPTAIYRWEAGRSVPQLRFFKRLREILPELHEPPRDAANDADVDADSTGEHASIPAPTPSPTGTGGR